MDTSELIASVKKRIDELIPEDELTIVSSANSSVNTIAETIESLINESAIEVGKSAPFHMCVNLSHNGSVTVVDDVGTVIMPADFMRFGYVKFGVWNKTVFEPIEIGSKEYDKQRNKYIRGGYSKPVVAIGKNKNNVYYIELYTIKEADKNNGKEIVYIPYPTGAEWISTVNSALHNSIAWLIASKVLSIFKQPDLGKRAYEQYLSTLK